MKIRDLKLLPEHHSGGSYSGMDNIGTISWGDWVLEEIDGNKLALRIREGIDAAGQKGEAHFLQDTYKSLTDEQKREIEEIFKGNIGKTIEIILNLDSPTQ